MKKNVSKSKLYDSFSTYFDFVKSQFRTRNKEKTNVLYVDRSYWLRTIVESIENSREFKNLLLDTSLPCYNLKNFLRRSRLYLNVFENESENIDGYFEQLLSAFSKRSVKITSLRLLEFVDFFDSNIDFGTFRIQRFSKEELDNLFDNQINNIFYPNAELDSKKLREFWFIIEESFKEESKLEIEILDLNLAESTKISRNFPDQVVQLLSLYDWERLQQHSDDMKEDLGWGAFTLPISFHITDNIFESPCPSPDLSRLYFEPVIDSAGQEIGERAYFGIHLLEKELDRFKKIINESQIFLYNIDLKKCDWEFLDRAMGYLAKAFLTDGFEQLLWHITVLEVLLVGRNEKDAGITSNIRRRLGILFGENEKQNIKDICQKITKLYDFRSELVHGRDLKEKKNKPKEIYLYHLRIARELARRSLFWFIEALSFLHTELIKNNIPLEKYPKQDEILFSIDFQLKSLKGEFGEIPFYLRT